MNRHILSVCALLWAAFGVSTLALAQEGETAEPQIDIEIGLSVGPETERPLPRFQTLRFKKANLRRGAGTGFPIAVVYTAPGLPVLVFREYRDWREIRDHEGTTGWIKRTQLSLTRRMLIQGDGVALRKLPDATSKTVVKLGPGVIAEARECNATHCRLSINGYRGWAPKTALWGVGKNETFEAD